MWIYWWSVFVESFQDSLATIGKDPTDILFSVVVFVVVGLLLLTRRGWGKGWADVRAKLGAVLGEDILIIFGLFVLILAYHMAKDSYLRWKGSSDLASHTQQQFEQYKAEAESRKPNFLIRLDGIIAGPAGDPGNALVGAVAIITNQGDPSSIDDFWIDVKFSDGRILHAEIAGAPAAKTKFYFGKNIQGTRMYLPGSEYWLNENLEPIVRYGERRGFLMGLVRGTTKAELIHSKAALVFTCSDATGKKYSSQDTFELGRQLASEGIALQGLQQPIPAHH